MDLAELSAIISSWMHHEKLALYCADRILLTAYNQLKDAPAGLCCYPRMRTSVRADYQIQDQPSLPTRA